MDLIKWIEEWYLSNCNNDWEHCYGVKIDNIDNPGWTINIDLIDTPLKIKILKRLNLTGIKTIGSYVKLKTMFSNVLVALEISEKCYLYLNSGSKVINKN